MLLPPLHRGYMARSAKGQILAFKLTVQKEKKRGTQWDAGVHLPPPKSFYSFLGEGLSTGS